VTFVDLDSMSSDRIILKSVDDLDKVFKGGAGNVDYFDEIKMMPSLVNSEHSKEETSLSTRYWHPDYLDMQHFNSEVRVPSGINTYLVYAFNYSRKSIQMQLFGGITDVQSYLRGFTFGISYSQNFTITEDYMNSNRTPHYIGIFGVLNYNVVIEGLGTVYSQSTQTDIFFTPSTNRLGGAPTYYNAFMRFR